MGNLPATAVAFSLLSRRGRGAPAAHHDAPAADAVPAWLYRSEAFAEDLQGLVAPLPQWVDARRSQETIAAAHAERRRDVAPAAPGFFAAPHWRGA